MKQLLLLALLLLPVMAEAAVATSDSGTRVVEACTNASCATVDLTTLTVSAGSNLCLIAVASFAQDVSSLTIVWDPAGTNQSMTRVGTGVLNGGRVEIFRLIAPTTGNLTLRAAWTSNSDVVLGAVAFSGADQTTCVNSSNNVTNTGTGTALSTGAVTSTTDGATVAGFALEHTINSVDQTELWRGNATFIGGAASYALGGSSNTHTGVGASSADWAAMGVNVIAASAGGALPRGRVR